MLNLDIFPFKCRNHAKYNCQQCSLMTPQKREFACIITCIMHMPCWGWGEEMNVNDFGEGGVLGRGKGKLFRGF